MKRTIIGLLLLGCQTSPPPSPSSSPSVSVSSTATPEIAASARPEKPLTNDDIIRLTSNSTSLGMTHQARIDLLMQHLVSMGRKRLVANWEVTNLPDGAYEVSYSIVSGQSEGNAEKTSTPTPTPTRKAVPERPSRNDPFARPPELATAKFEGVRLSWVYNPTNSTCIPKDEATQKFVALQPTLEASGLEEALPARWKAADPAGRNSQPPPEPPPERAPEPPAPPPQPKPKPAPDRPRLPEDMPKMEEPVKFEGFIGSGDQRRAILSQGMQHFNLGPGDKIGPYKIRSISDEEMVLEEGGGQFRVIPGQTLP